MGLTGKGSGIVGCGMKGGKGLRVEEMGVGKEVEADPDLIQSRN